MIVIYIYIYLFTDNQGPSGAHLFEDDSQPGVSGVSTAHCPPSAASGKGCVLTRAVLESQGEIVKGINDINCNLEKLTGALKEINETLKELVKK